jgi:hypothetical protein
MSDEGLSEDSAVLAAQKILAENRKKREAECLHAIQNALELYQCVIVMRPESIDALVVRVTPTIKAL